MGSADTSEPPLVLVVEDNQDLLALTELVLSGAGYAVAGAPDGRAGLDLARTLHPAAVVLDMMMPDMDGLEFLDALPSCGQPVPPVVVTSGFPDFEPHARRRGAFTFLRKPASPEELVAAVGRALAGRREPRAERAQAARVEAGREEAQRARAELLARIDLDDPALRAMLEGVLAWFSRYEGFGTGLVDLLCGDKIYVEAGAAATRLVDRGLAFCSDVVDAGSSLVISDVDVHPVFKGHQAAAYWGTRFYAGCPITVSGGRVLGTVCLIDRVPRRFEIGDMRILEYLARRVGEHFEALADRRSPSPFFEPPGLFEPTAVGVILGAQLATPAGAYLGLVTFPRGAASPVLGRAAEALGEAVSARRFAAARWSDETLAFVSDGAHPPAAIDRASSRLPEVGAAPSAVGVARCRPATGPSGSVAEVIAVAEDACARSADAGGTLVHVVVPECERRAA